MDFEKQKIIIKQAIDKAKTPIEVLEKIIEIAYREGVKDSLTGVANNTTTQIKPSERSK